MASLPPLPPIGSEAEGAAPEDEDFKLPDIVPTGQDFAELGENALEATGAVFESFMDAYSHLTRPISEAWGEAKSGGDAFEIIEGAYRGARHGDEGAQFPTMG